MSLQLFKLGSRKSFLSIGHFSACQQKRFQTSNAGISQFIPKELFQGQEMTKVGRKWEINELRTKSFEELHSLYYILYKERNRLVTVYTLNRLMKGRKRFHRPGRLRKVKKAMGYIKSIFKERRVHAMRLARDEFEEKKKNGLYQWPIPDWKRKEIELEEEKKW